MNPRRQFSQSHPLRWILYFFIGLTCLSPARALAAALPHIIELSSVQESIRVDSVATTFEDCDGRLDIWQADSLARNGRFKPSDPKGTTFGYSTCAYWLRLIVRDQNQEHRDWYLKVNDPRVNHVDWYQRRDDAWSRMSSGSVVKIAHRSIHSRYVAFPMDPPKAEPQAVYLRMQTNDVAIFPVSIITSKAFHAREYEEEFAMGLYFGVLLYTIILNAFMFFHVRDWTYFTCIFAIFFYAVFQACVNALDVAYLWPNHPGWNSYAIPISCGLSIASYTLFSWLFLDMQKRGRPWRWIMYSLVAAGALLIVLAMLKEFSLAGLLGSLISPAALVGVWAMSVVALRQGSSQAKYSLISGVILALGVVLDGLSNLAMLPVSPLTTYFDQITSTLFVFSLTLSLAARFKSIRRKRTMAERAAAEFSRETAEAKLQALQARINPHFLFNTLTSVAGLIHEAPERAEAVVIKLSRLFRYILAATEQSMKVRLVEELAIVRSYLEIESERYADRLKFHIDTEGDVESVTLPGLTLQPLVENCIKHGLKNKCDGGQVTVLVRVEPSCCHLVVEDNGIGMPESQPHAGHGLSSVQNRLLLAYGSAAQMRLVNGVGLRVEIDLPLRSTP